MVKYVQFSHLSILLDIHPSFCCVQPEKPNASTSTMTHLDIEENRGDRCEAQRILTIIGIEAYKAMGFHSSYSKTSKRRRMNESGCIVSGTDLGYTACMDLWMLCPSTKRCPHVEAIHKHCLFLKVVPGQVTQVMT